MALARIPALLLLSVLHVPCLLANTSCPGGVASLRLRPTDGYRFIAPVFIDGKGPYDFLLDTGSQATVLDHTLAAELHLATEGAVTISGIGIRSPATIAHVDRLEVGAHSIASLRVLVSEVRPFEFPGASFRGILGESFLQHFDTLLDNRHQFLCLDDGAALRTAIRGEHIPLVSSPGSQDESGVVTDPVIWASLSNARRRVRLKLDSGANRSYFLVGTGLLSVDFIRVRETSADRPDGAKGQLVVALLSEQVQSGSLRLENVPFYLPVGWPNELLPKTTDGVLALGLFRRVFISKTLRFAILEPGW